MKKKIDVRDLKAGMYVYELDRPWRDTPFPFQGFQIENDEAISQLREHCEHVFIDPDRSLATVSSIQAWRVPRPMPAEGKQGPKAELHEVVEKTTAHRPRRVYQDQTTSWSSALGPVPNPLSGIACARRAQSACSRMRQTHEKED